MTNIAHKITSILQELFEDIRNGGVISLHEPRFDGNELKYVEECIKTGWVSSVGSFVDRFEKDLAEFLGAKHAIAIVNGTAALHLCLVAAGVKAKDEVLVPAMTFVATANAVSYQQAIPHFVDVSEKTLGICPNKLSEYLEQIADIENGQCINRKTGRVIRAIIPMHTFGHMVDMDELNKVAKKYNISVIEDAAESLGSLYKGKHAGTLGQMAAISFNGNKIITTGGGGAIVTNDDEIAKKLKHLSTTARAYNGYKFSHDEVGYNYRLPNINAAMGCAQLEYLPDIIARKRKLSEQYKASFADVAEVEFIEEPSDSTSNYWLNAIRLKDAKLLEEVLDVTNKAGFMTRPVWDIMPNLPMYKTCPSMDVSNSQLLSSSIINLPSSYFLVK